MQRTQGLSLDDLSDAELAAVFRAVPAAQHTRLASVCRRWRAICTGGDVWPDAVLKSDRLRDNGPMYAWFQERRGPLHTLTLVMGQVWSWHLLPSPCTWGPLHMVLGLLGDTLRHLTVIGDVQAPNRDPSLAWLVVLRGLRSLWLDYTRSHGVAACAVYPSGLTELTLRYKRGASDHLHGLPPGLSRLTALRALRANSLRVDSGGMPVIPAGDHPLEPIRGLAALELLDVRSSTLGSLPAWLPQHSRLTALCLAGCRRSRYAHTLPIEHIEVVVGLPALRALDLRHCRVAELPPLLAGLTALRVLLLSHNRLAALPEGPYLERLERLGLGGNTFSSLPQALLACTTLQQLGLASDPAMHPGAMLSLESRALRSLLSSTPGLRELCLHRGSLPSGVPARLRASFPQAQVLLLGPGEQSPDDRIFGSICAWQTQWDGSSDDLWDTDEQSSGSDDSHSSSDSDSDDSDSSSSSSSGGSDEDTSSSDDSESSSSSSDSEDA
ncbi:hypothetical protein ABPG75_003204 [Micractinium tetrahymenae]